MNFEILEAAEDEWNEAVAYYEAIEPGLGIRLKDEVQRVTAGSVKIRRFRAYGPGATAG